MIRKIFFLFAIIPVLCHPMEDPSSELYQEEEALSLRRIADFWQEGEYQIAKKEIEDFLKNYPHSEFSNLLCVALGDLYVREKNPKDALTFYTRVTSGKYFDRAFLSRMQCLYQIEWYATLADECEAHLESRSDLADELKLQTTYYLAIALYQQCLNAAKEPLFLEQLAKRAEPHFETLFNSDLSNEVAQAFAHLCCILKDYQKASKIYLELAEKEQSEDLLFQAALLQAEYDKDLAILTFDEIIQKKENRAEEAAYNKLVLAFEMKRYAEIAESREKILRQMPKDKLPLSHFFIGRSFAELENHTQALDELLSYIESAEKSEHLRVAILSLFDAAQAMGNLEAFEAGLAKSEELFPKDPTLAKGRLVKAQLLKQNEKIEEAIAEIDRFLAEFPEHPKKIEAEFEQIHLAHLGKKWEISHEKALSFLTNTGSTFNQYVWRYLVTASAELAAREPPEKTSLKERLLHELKLFFENSTFASIEEKHEWEFLKAKTLYELKCYGESLAVVQKIDSPPLVPNAKLLSALCYNEGLGDFPQFIHYAEEALQEGADLMDLGDLHLALFNAYLEFEDTQQKMAEHLYSAYTCRAPLQLDNLVWLIEMYYAQIEQEECPGQFISSPLQARARELLQTLFEREDIDPLAISEETLYLEPLLCKLGNIYAFEKRFDDLVSLMKTLQRQYEKEPDLQWTCHADATLLLAFGYSQTGEIDKAWNLYEKIVSTNPTLRSWASAKACLEGAKLCISEFDDEEHVQRAIIWFKNLSLQKHLASEPNHLEAAIEYADLMANLESESLEKKIALLTRAREDFESDGDLLSKDYQQSRLQMLKKDRLVRLYLQFIDAEILFCKSELTEEESEKKELRAKAKETFLALIEEPTLQPLIARASDRLSVLKDVDVKSSND